MKSIGAEFLRPDALPGVNHMRVMKYKIVKNFNMAATQIYVHNSYTKHQH